MNTEKIASQISGLIPRLHKGIKSKYLFSKGISSAQLVILTNLEAIPRMSLKKLAYKIGVAPATVSVAVDKLVKTGQIKRVQDSCDRRKINIALTAAGKRKLNRLRKEIEGFWFQMLKRSLSLKEQKIFLNIMEKVVKELESE